MFYIILTSRDIFIAKTGLDLFSLGRKQVWTYSVLGDLIYEMRCNNVQYNSGFTSATQRRHVQ